MVHQLFRERSFRTASLCLVLLQIVLLVWRFSSIGPGFEGSESFRRISTGIVQDGDFGSALRPPLYPLFLAGNMFLFPSGWDVTAALLQAAGGVLCGMLIGLVAYKLSDQVRIAVTAMVLYGLHFLFQIEVTAQRDTILITLFVVAFVFVVPLFVADRPARHIVWAAVVAGAFLTRASAVVLAPLLVLVIAWQLRNESWRRRITGLIVPLTFFGTLVLPWQLTVSRFTGEIPVGSAASSGQNLWKGNNPFFFSLWPVVDVDAMDPYLRARDPRLHTAESDELLEQEAIDFIAEHPGWFAQALVRKFVGFFNPIPTPMGTATIQLRDGKVQISNFEPRNIALALAATLHFLVIFVCWMLLLFRAGQETKRVKGTVSLSLLVVLAFAAMHAICFPESRYRLPIDIVLIPFAAIFLDRAREIVADRMAGVAVHS